MRKKAEYILTGAAAISSFLFLAGCGGTSNTAAQTVSAMQNTWYLAEQVTGTVTQTTDYSPVVTDLEEEETRTLDLKAEGSQATDRYEYKGTVKTKKSDKDAVKQDVDGMLDTSNGKSAFYYKEGDKWQQTAAVKKEVTPYLPLLEAMADGKVKYTSEEDATGHVSNGTVQKMTVTLDGDSLSYLDDWTLQFATGITQQMTVDTDNGEATVTFYSDPSTGKLVQTDLDGKNLFRTEMSLYGTKIYTETSDVQLSMTYDQKKYNETGDISVPKDKASEISTSDYNRQRFLLLHQSESDGNSPKDVSKSTWEDLSFELEGTNYALPMPYLDVAEKWLFRDKDCYAGMKLKDGEYVSTELVPVGISGIKMEAVIGNQSGKIQDITECDILQVSLTNTKSVKKAPQVSFAKGLTFGIPEGNLENLWGVPADGGKKESSAYQMTQYLYEDQNRYAAVTVDASDGVKKVELGILTNQMGIAGTGSSTDDKETDAEAKKGSTDADTTSTSSDDAQDVETSASASEGVTTSDIAEG